MKAFLFWFLVLCVQLFGTGIAYHYGLQNVILTSDPTFLTFGIIALQTWIMLRLGWNIFWYNRDVNLRGLDLDAYWYYKDTYVNLGMIGTVAGFIISSTVFLHLTGISDVMSADKVKQVVSAHFSVILTGMFTALWATLAGLVAAAFLAHVLKYVEKQQKLEADEMNSFDNLPLEF